MTEIENLYGVRQQVGGASLVDRYRVRKADNENGLIRGFFTRYQQSPEERRDQRTSRPPWWALPTKNTLDRATATLPKLLYERLDDIGLDFPVLYPTLGLLFPHMGDEELRRGGCRAMNRFHADIFREYADRMTPAALRSLTRCSYLGTATPYAFGHFS